MRELGSAPVPPVGPADHRRGVTAESPPIILYADFECPFCAALHAAVAELALAHVFRHFPVRSSHPRAWPAACAAEAAGLQGRFWEMHDRMFAAPSRLEDPHLWEHARALGLDVARFDSERRSDAVIARVRADFDSGVRAGVVTTPTVFAGARVLAGRIEPATLRELAAGSERR